MIYKFNPHRIVEENIPSQLRQPKQMQWLRVLFNPLAYVAKLFTREFINGAMDYDKYDVAVTYTKNNRVIWKDRGVYELKVSTAIAIPPTGDTASVDTWRKVLNDFIGVDERLKTNGQLIVFEYAINRHFGIKEAPYIYVGTPNSSTIDIYIPAAVFNDMGDPTYGTRAQLRVFTDLYMMSFQIMPHSY